MVEHAQLSSLYITHINKPKGQERNSCSLRILRACPLKPEARIPAFFPEVSNKNKSKGES